MAPSNVTTGETYKMVRKPTKDGGIEGEILEKLDKMGIGANGGGLGSLPRDAVIGLLAMTFGQGSIWDTTDVGIKHEGREITLPADPERMPIPKGIEALTRIMKDQEQEFRVMETIDAFPHDGAVAFVKAMTKLYGFASPQTVMTMFGPKPPTMLSIKTGHGIDDVVQCPMGRFLLPGVDNPIDTGMGPVGPNETWSFYVSGSVKKKDKERVLEIVKEARRIVKAESIYRGKALRFTVDEMGQIDMSNPPEFMDVTDINHEGLIFDQTVQDQIDTSIMTPIRRTAECEAAGIPLRRGVLLEGPYGCGKSLTAKLTAHVAETNGWTFVLLDRVQGLQVALEFANRYAPAVVFAEDVDRIAHTRTDSTNDLINIIDGVLSKSSRVMTVLTTNFVEKLDRSILRPGRLDAIISIKPPLEDAVRRLIIHYGGTLLERGANLDEVYGELKGQIPASIREAVERSKLTMLSRGAKQINGHDLFVAAKTMKNHLDLLNNTGKGEPSAGERLASVLREVCGFDPTALHQTEANLHGTVNGQSGSVKQFVDHKGNEVNGNVSVAVEMLKKISRKVGA